MANEALIAAQEGADVGLSDQEIYQQLTGVELDRFLKLQATFESDGWSIIQEWCATKEVEAGVSGANAASWEDNREQYGRRIAWLYHVPGIHGLTRATYAWIAANRQSLGGKCDDKTCKPVRHSERVP